MFTAAVKALVSLLFTVNRTPRVLPSGEFGAGGITPVRLLNV